MLKIHFKIAWRNLLRNRGFSLLNIVGLSIGLAVTAFILIWVDFELGYDRFHKNVDRIYEVNNQYEVAGEFWTWNSTPKIMAPTIKKDYPEVELTARYNWDTHFLFSKGEKRIQPSGNMVDADFLKIFSFPLVLGNIETVLNKANSLVITETLAAKLFGSEDPIGQIVKVDNTHNFEVTGVLKDLPSNTDFNFEFLMSWEYLKQKGWNDEHWGNNSVTTYVLVKEGINHESFQKKISTLRESYDDEAPDMVTLLYPFSRTYLYSEFENGKEVGGRIDLIRLFAIIAIIVLVIACINFMNLSTARSEKRAREVGIRKVVGAKKSSLIGQFLGESLLISFLAAFLALILVVALLPLFNILIGQELVLDWKNHRFWLSALAIVAFTGFLAGSYPALYLSAFRPSSVLKGTFKKMNAVITPRKVLVVVQFSVAIVLITATIIVKQQIKKVQERQLGYAKNSLIYSFIEGDADKNYEQIKNELLESGAVLSLSKTNSPITESWSNSMGMEWSGKDPEDRTLIHRLTADNGIVKTMGLELIEGRDFNLNGFPTDSTAAILNESAAKLMGFENPIGQTFKDNGIEWHIVGLTKDFVFNSPFQKIEPLVIEGAKTWFNVVHIKLHPEKSVSESLAFTEAVFKKYNPEYPFSYNFIDAEYSKKFNDQKRNEQLAELFTLLTIFISCLGLFGLASNMAENRIKEIGVRKVLGASVSNITLLLSKNFLQLVIVSLILATPISWYFMNSWLQDFAYKITISWWIFALAGTIALIIASATVSFHAIKAANTNPAKSLRTE